MEEKTAMRNSEGTRVEDEGEILEVYEKFYLDLLQTPRPENETERQMEEEVEATFERICFRSENQGPMEVDENNIRNVRKKLKRRKAGDREGWNNEMILEAGEEMVKSLKIMFNRILKEHSIPRQWTEMTTKSIHKKYVYGCVCMCVYVSPHVDGMLCMHLDYSNMSIPFISLHCLLSQYLQLQKP